MKLNFIFIILLLGYSIEIQANDTLNKSRVRISDFNILLGSSSQSGHIASLSDFRNIAGGSEILKKDYSNFLNKSYNYSTNTPTFSLLLGIELKKKQSTKSNHKLRIGINSFSYSFDQKYFKSSYYSHDTINAGSYTINVDSINSEQLSIYYYSGNLSFDLSYLFSTDQEARWSIYSGIGFRAGFSLNNYVNINYSSNDYVTVYLQNTYPRPIVVQSESRGEFINTKRNSIYSAYIPLGIDFRIGKQRTFWKRLHLFLEMQPGVNFISIPGVENISQSFFQASLGLKIKV